MSVKCMSVVSVVGALVFWTVVLISLWDTAMQAQGRLLVSAILAGTNTVVAALCRLHREREKDVDDRLRLITGEYRRREAAIIKTAALLVDGPTTGPFPRLYPVASAGGHR